VHAEPGRVSKHVRLIVEVGRAKGQTVEVHGPKFAIGRDARCQLRPNSETISRVHATIEQRDGRVFVRDAGTVNGTVVNDRTLKGEEAEVSDGDRLQVGVLRFTFSIRDRDRPEAPRPEEMAVNWMLGEHATDASAATALFVPKSEEFHRAAEAASAPDQTNLRHVGYRLVDGVLVVTVRTSKLDDEETVAPLRHDLRTLLDTEPHDYVVIDLGQVKFLSPRAVGVILAAFQRIDQGGGTMRVCNADPALAPVLDSMRLPQLVDVFGSLDQAIHARWE
jgi:anti-anti-sigma factor